MFYAGMDWSGKSNKDKYLICVLAATLDAEAWSNTCTDLRRILGMKQSAEFHARDMNEAENFTVLQAARNAGIVFGASVGESPDSTNTQINSYEGIAQELFRTFAMRCQIKTLWYDKGNSRAHRGTDF